MSNEIISETHNKGKNFKSGNNNKKQTKIIAKLICGRSKRRNSLHSFHL